MARNPLIEAILDKWWQYQYEPFEGREAARRERDRLIQEQIQRSGRNTTVEEVLDGLYPEFKEFRKARAREKISKLPPRA